MKRKTIAIKHRIVSALLALVMLFSSLLGTTYAWFTDRAESRNNVVTAGRLDAKMYYADELLERDSADWKSADGVPVFTNKNWEPGYTEVKYVKIENAGNLAFRWMLSIEAAGSVSELADVIDVYYVNPVTEQLTGIAELESVGTLSDVIASHTTTTGVILPEGESAEGLDSGCVTLAVAMHMQDSAENEYQDESVSDEGFMLKLIATQYSYESDSFGGAYDEDATWPGITAVGTVTVAVTTDSEGKLTSDYSGETLGGAVSYLLPEGMKLADGVSELTVTVSNLSGGSNLEIADGEEKQSLDVHVEGVAEDNTVPAIITLPGAMPKGLNLGNYKIYHFEDGVANEMTLTPYAELDAHNEFSYDPVTGDVSVALATYSELALVADTENPWEGAIATSFADGSGTEDDPYLIANADQMAYFSQCISRENETYGSAYYKLISDVNFGGEDAAAAGNIYYPAGYWAIGGEIATASLDEDDAPEFLYFDEDADYAVSDGVATVADSVTNWYTYGGSFKGVFDGNGNTVKNIYQNTWQMKGNYDGNYYNAAMGIFGYVNGGTVKNLTVENFTSDGEFTPTGVIAAYAAGNALFKNISVFDSNPRVYNTGNGGIIGVAGDSESANMPDNTITLENITVDQSNKISALWGSWDVACGGLMGMFRGYSKVNMTNCHVAAQIDVNNDVCANYQYYWYRYAGMFIGSVRRNTTDGTYTVALTDGITATGCTYKYGDWNEYWYCELVANTKASYTHDHQFSRLTKIASVADIQDADGNWNTEGNFVLPAEDNSSATCYHIFKDSEGNLYQHFHDVADESNTEIYETFDLDGNGELDDLKEDRTCYYIPFGQLMTGSGWGVKAEYEFAGIEEAEDDTVTAQTKFEAITTVATYTPGTTVRIGDLFESTVDDSKLSMTSIFVAVSPVGPGTASATYQINLSDWTDGTLAFAEDSTGIAKVVITDYFYCKETVIYLSQPSSVEKFTANTVGSYDADTTVTLGDLFTVNDGVTLGNITATVTMPDGSTKEISATADTWLAESITLSQDGEWTVTIFDDSYCTATQTTFTVNPIEKFTVNNNVESRDADTTVTLGDLFTVNDGVTLSSITATVTMPDGSTNEISTTADTWSTESITLSQDGEWTVTITDKYGCIEAQTTFTVNAIDKFEIAFPNTDTYLYRVGNANAVALGSLFEEISGVSVDDSTVEVSFEFISGASLSGTYTPNTTDWTQATIQFSATGVVSVTITAEGAKPVVLNLEVVDATNITSATGTTAGGDLVLLCDVNSTDYVNYWNCTLYGNGFTYSLNGAPTDYNSKQGNGVIIAKNATLDNLVIVGDVYSTYGAYTTQSNYNGAVEAINTTIQNCYISNCATPVRGNGVTIANTTLYGGTVANLILSGGTNILTDLTTVNYNDDRAVVGFGILVSDGASENTKIILNGELKQYNYLCDTDVSDVPGDEAKAVFNSMFADTFADYHIGSDPTYVNTGIIFMTEELNTDIITDNTNCGYMSLDDANISLTVSGYTTTVNGAIYALPGTGGTVDNGYSYSADNHVSTTQGDYLPTPEFALGDQMISKDDENDVDYLIGDIDGLEAMYEEGGSGITIDLSALMKVYKYEGSYYTVVAKCVDSDGNELTVTNGEVTLTEMGKYTLVYTVNDNIFYGADGNAITRSIERVYEVSLSLSVYEKSVADATITISSTALTGEYKSSGTSYYYQFYPMQAITSIMDDANKDGTLEEFDFKSNIASATISSVGDNAFSGITTIVVTYSGGQELTITLGVPSNLSSPSVANGGKTLSVTIDSTYGIYVKSDGKTTASTGTWPISGWSFVGTSAKEITDATAVTINFTKPSSCVTADTLVTLSDGTQKRIDEVTYEDKLLVWDFNNGVYTVANASIICNHGYAQNQVITLTFEDGTTVKVVNVHGFFDADLNKWVDVNAENAQDYVGHSFVQSDKDSYKSVKLVSAEVKTEYVEAWSILSANYYNCLLEGMFSVTPPATEQLAFFEIGENMTYDAEAKAADIEKYGLYTYDEFAHLLTYEQFDALNIAQIKIAVGKGMITYEEVLGLINTYAN